MTEQEKIIEILTKLDKIFYTSCEFWIFFVLGLLSLAASVKAFTEAREAKLAAKQAGSTVKIQTITIELSEIIQKLDKLDLEIDFSSARDFLNEVNRKIKRLTAPFKDESSYKDVILDIYNCLNEGKEALDEVRPIEKNNVVVENAVYHGIESHFSDLSGKLAELMGLFEKKTIEF